MMRGARHSTTQGAAGAAIAASAAPAASGLARQRDIGRLLSLQCVALCPLLVISQTRPMTISLTLASPWSDDTNEVYSTTDILYSRCSLLQRFYSTRPWPAVQIALAGPEWAIRNPPHHATCLPPHAYIQVHMYLVNTTLLYKYTYTHTKSPKLHHLPV